MQSCTLVLLMHMSCSQMQLAQLIQSRQLQQQQQQQAAAAVQAHRDMMEQNAMLQRVVQQQQAQAQAEAQAQQQAAQVCFHIFGWPSDLLFMLQT
jgi:hypothetical protein